MQFKLHNMLEAFRTFLQQFPDYHPEVYQQALPHLTERHLEQGEYFLRHGSVCNQVVFVKKGLLRLYYLDAGKEVSDCFCKENTLATSYRSLVTRQASDIAIQAVEASQLLQLSYDSLQHLYTLSPFWQQLGRLALENELLTVEAHQRFLRGLSATDKYLHILEKEPELLQRVPLNYLATYLQIAPETLSRIRSKLART